MDIQFEKHLLELLKNNACVIIPNFGGFINKEIPSSIQGSVISPPSKQLAFNQYLKHDDELLTGALMNNYGLNYESAKNKVLTFSNHIQYTLRKNQQYKLNKIGSFSVNEQNQIVFKPFLHSIEDKATFGLHQIHFTPLAKPVISENKTRVKEKSKHISEAKKIRKENIRSTSKLPLAGLVTSFLLFAGVAALMITNTHLAPIDHQKAGFSDILFPKTEHVSSFDNRREIANHLNNSSNTKPKELNSTGRILTVNKTTIAEGYYIVSGSYSSLENAQRLEQQLFDEGKDSYILESDKGLYRVCSFAHKNYTQAAKQLTKEKETSSKGYWLLRNAY